MIPFSEAAERNKYPIFEVIADLLRQSEKILEIGSGTGQHALYFAENMPHLNWCVSDRSEYICALKKQIQQAGLENISGPLELDVNRLPWPYSGVDLVYTANTLHIMDWQSVRSFFTGVDLSLNPRGYLVIYGPFKYQGEFTSASNADFDLALKIRDSQSGIRDFEEIDRLAKPIGLSLVADHSMPANNQCLIFQRFPMG